MKNHRFVTAPMFAICLTLTAVAGVVAQTSGSAIAVGGPPQVLNGEIRWKKALGTVPFVAGLSAPHSDPCSAFYVLVVTADQAETLITYTDKLSWKPKAGAFNICDFRVTVSSNTPIRVYAVMGRKSGATEEQTYLYLHGGWSGGEKIPYDSFRYGGVKGRNFYPGNLIDPQPETGYKRGFRPSYHALTLSPTMASFISFEMVYGSNRDRTVPRYTDPPVPPPKPPFITAGQPIVQPYSGLASVYLGWDGGPDHPNVQVWCSIDNGAEIPGFSINLPSGHPLFKQPKVPGAELKLQRGHYYKYVLKDGGTTLSTVAFTVP
jgi:hypothetical protein